MNGYSKDTQEALQQEILSMLAIAQKRGQNLTGTFENDEATVRIVARADGTFSLQHNYGMLARRFAAIAAEVESESAPMK